VQYRNQNKFQSIADLLDVTAPQNQNSGGNGNSGQATSTQMPSGSQNSSGASGSSSGGSGGSGSKVISQDLLLEFADDITVVDGKDLPGMININTAGLDVLRCLPGVDRQLAQAIISYRQSSGSFANIAELLKVGGMSLEIFKQVAPLVSARSEAFRILSEGKVTSTGARQRIQEIVHVGLNDLSTLEYREDDL
jgi:competence ComEA-like helix-hairpin-helix protein